MTPHFTPEVKKSEIFPLKVKVRREESVIFSFSLFTNGSKDNKTTKRRSAENKKKILVDGHQLKVSYLTFC
jgi:hypothetical protein